MIIRKDTNGIEYFNWGMDKKLFIELWEEYDDFNPKIYDIFPAQIKILKPQKKIKSNIIKR